MSLLQTAASAKAGTGISRAGVAETASAKHHPTLCSEPEALHNFSVYRDPEPLDAPPLSDSAAPAFLESHEAEPDPFLVSLLRQTLWLLSFAIAANGTMRWRQQEPPKPECTTAVAPRVRKPADTTGVAPQRSALHKAALEGDDVRCESLLRQAPDALATADAWGTTALHAAATGGAQRVVELFLDHGAPVDPVNASDETPLHLAARRGHVEVCEILTQRGASLRAANAEDQTPLVVAGYAEQEKVCMALLALGAGVEGLPEEDLPEFLLELRVA